MQQMPFEVSGSFFRREGKKAGRKEEVSDVSERSGKKSGCVCPYVIGKHQGTSLNEEFI